ncbi:MAG: DNA topoisomerase IV subunit B, partial [Wenzhouxiangellaceae bacterium]
MSTQYQASDIEVLQGLEPVKRRPGMYTDTTRPNHLVAEVVDNSVDEALAGYAKNIDVILHEDGSVSVTDDGRGMPVDPHPEHKLPGVELILTRLHAGGKFSGNNYKFSGGLHGVGVSVVNALSERLICRIKRDGKLHEMEFAHGDTVSPLKVIDEVGKRNTGTLVRFWPEEQYFDSANISRPRLKHLLKAKAILCPGLKVTLNDEKAGEVETWQFEDGLTDYLTESLEGRERVPETPFTGEFSGADQEAAWALAWLPEGELVQESYVNLIPTPAGGTHTNGLRTGLIEALREF